MKITYKPKGEKKKPAVTNIGTFQPGETKLIPEEQITEAKRLIAAGSFVEAGATKAEKKADAEPATTAATAKKK